MTFDHLALDVTGPITAEVLTVVRTEEGLMLTGPCGAAPWLIEAVGDHPLDTVRRIVEGVIPGVLLVHSTSWRFERGMVFLTFVAVADSAGTKGMKRAPIEQANLARSAPKRAPLAITTNQVLEHALRHVAWLAREDPVVGEVLDSGWHRILEGYVPEPFRHLETGG